jgi:hypothetical protein
MHRTTTTTILLSAITLFVSPAISTVCWGNNFDDAIDNKIWNVAYIQGIVNSIPMQPPPSSTSKATTPVARPSTSTTPASIAVTHSRGVVATQCGWIRMDSSMLRALMNPSRFVRMRMPLMCVSSSSTAVDGEWDIYTDAF